MYQALYANLPTLGVTPRLLKPVSGSVLTLGMGMQKVYRRVAPGVKKMSGADWAINPNAPEPGRRHVGLAEGLLSARFQKFGNVFRWHCCVVARAFLPVWFSPLGNQNHTGSMCHKTAAAMRAAIPEGAPAEYPEYVAALVEWCT